MKYDLMKSTLLDLVCICFDSDLLCIFYSKFTKPILYELFLMIDILPHFLFLKNCVLLNSCVCACFRFCFFFSQARAKLLRRVAEQNVQKWAKETEKALRQSGR